MLRNTQRQQPRLAGSDVSSAAVRRLARRGGVKRLSGDLYNEGRRVLNDFARKVLRKVQILAHHSKGKTVSLADMVQDLRHNGVSYYG